MEGDERPKGAAMRSLLLALSAAFLILATTACSGGQSAEPAPSVPLEQEAPADPEAPATSPGAAEDVAIGFLEAYGSFDADRAITYLAPDADVSGLISSVGGGSLDGGLEGFRLLLSMLEAEGYKQILHGCDDMGSGEGRTFLTCDFDFHVIRSDELGLGPYSGSHFFLTVRDGKIVDASKTWAIGEFSPQVWEPFAAWVAATYPEDVDVMYTGAQTGLRLTEKSISLWEQRTREYVEHVRSDGDGAAAAEQTAVAAETVAPPDYSDDSAWICRPGRDDVCEGSLDITMVSANGSTEVVEVPHASDAPVDCLYVYPTVSQDKLANSDLVPGETEEIAATLIQAARFGSVCDVYVPVYRQITLAALFREVAAASRPRDRLRRRARRVQALPRQRRHRPRVRADRPLTGSRPGLPPDPRGYRRRARAARAARLRHHPGPTLVRRAPRHPALHPPGSGGLPHRLCHLRRCLAAARHLRRRPGPVRQPGRPRRWQRIPASARAGPPAPTSSRRVRRRPRPTA